LRVTPGLWTARGEWLKYDQAKNKRSEVPDFYGELRVQLCYGKYTGGKRRDFSNLLLPEKAVMAERLVERGRGPTQTFVWQTFLRRQGRLISETNDNDQGAKGMLPLVGLEGILDSQLGSLLGVLLMKRGGFY